MDRDEYQTIILAALLHDIGKFWQRTGEKLTSEDEKLLGDCCPYSKEKDNYTHQHVLYSGRFIREYFTKRWEMVENIVLYHHLPQNAIKHYRYLTKIVTLSDWLSSGERRGREEEETGDPSKEPLVSIFSRIKITGDIPETYFPLVRLNKDFSHLFPKLNKKEAIRTDSYKTLWSQFENEVKLLDFNTPFETFINQLLCLLEKYTLFIPVATYRDKPDLSLYHHLKTTAAIASCLYQLKVSEEDLDQILESFKESNKASLQKEVCLLVTGDISGIQDFIYSVTSEDALKGLRGRSFYIQLLSETVAKYILRSFNLYPCNLLYAGGGHFYILLPLTREVREDLQDIEKEMDKLLLKAHRGRLSVILASHPIRLIDFHQKEFGNVWEKTGGVLAREKRRKFGSLLSEKEEFFKILGPFEEGGERKACKVCGEELSGGEEGECSLCKSFAELSSNLAQARFLEEEMISPKPLKGLPKTWYEIFEAMGRRYFPEVHKPQQSLVINSTEFLSQERRYKGFCFLNRRAPLVEGGIKTLDEFARDSQGVNNWGVFRADVDSLGEIFSKGLGEDKTISRMAMLSHLLSLFFSGYIESLASEYKDKIYVVYSGGDDLFVVGSWSALPDFAQKIYNEFRRFTSNNFTLSGGIFIAPSEKFPLYQAADSAGEVLEEAKKRGKDRITFLDLEEPMPWKEFREVEKVKDKIVELIDDGIPKALLFMLYSSWDEKELVKEGKVSMHRIWRLLYAFKRLKERYEEKAVELDELEKMVVIEKDLKPYLNIAVRWAELLTRKEG